MDSKAEHRRYFKGLINRWFELPNSHLVVVVEGNIYGQQKRKLRNKPKKGQEINYFTDLTPGDYVVHNMHGIGKYIGLKTIETEGIHRDYIEIAYAGTDKLFLPANNLDQLQNILATKVMCHVLIRWVAVTGARLLQRQKIY